VETLDDQQIALDLPMKLPYCSENTSKQQQNT